MSMKRLSKKQLNRFKMMGVLTVMLTPMVMSPATSVFAESNDTETQQANPLLTPDSGNLDKAVKAAQDAGAKVNVKDLNTKTIDYTDLELETKNVLEDYAKQVKSIETAQKKQAEKDKTYKAEMEKYKQALDKYNQALNAHKGEKPVIDKTVDGKKLQVFGDYDKDKTGSYKYYGKFDAVFDLSDHKNTKVLSKMGWFNDSKFTVEKSADKKIYTTDDVHKAGHTNVTAQMQWVRHPQKGDVYRLTNAGVDAITGEKYDFIMQQNAGVTSKDAFVGFKKGSGNSVAADITGMTGVQTSTYFVPAGKAAEQKNAIDTIMSFVSSDIDNDQGGKTNMGNLGILNPKESDVKVNSDGSYENISGAAYDDEASTPAGTLGLYGTGKIYNWDFYNHKSTRKVENLPGQLGSYRYNILGTGTELKAVVKPPMPVKPEAETVDVQKTVFELNPGETTPITKAVVTDISDWKLVAAQGNGDTDKHEADDKPAENDGQDVENAASEAKPDVKREAVANDDTQPGETDAPDVDELTKPEDEKSDTETNSDTVVTKGQTFGYTVSTTIDAVNEDGQLIENFQLKDNLEDALTLDGVQVIDKTSGDDITKDFAQSENITMTLNSDKLKDYRGHEVEWRIGVHIDENADLSGYKQDDGSYLVKNVASKVQNDTPTESNDVDVTLDKDPEPKPEEQKPEEQKPEEQAPKKLPNTGVNTLMGKIVSFISEGISHVAAWFK